MGFKPFYDRKLTRYAERELKGCSKYNEGRRVVDLIRCISVLTTSPSLDKFSRFTYCGTGIRFGGDVRQKFSESTNRAESTVTYMCHQREREG